MRITNNKGFTLLEIIIVIIIIAVLASVAMPKITSSLTFAKSKEALGAIPSFRQAMEECYLLNNGSYDATACSCTDTATCKTNLGVEFAGKYFGTMAITGKDKTYDIVLTCTASDCDNRVDIITYDSASGGSVTGGGAFSKIKTGK